MIAVVPATLWIVLCISHLASQLEEYQNKTCSIDIEGHMRLPLKAILLYHY